MAELNANPKTEDYVLVRTDDIGLRTFLLETTEPAKLEEVFKVAAPTLGLGERLDAVKRSTEILFSAVGVDPSSS